ncbi:MAG: VWA domain-containing protein [Candidatus Micrarchaeota archaeon]|nr:VWA domain-containing protein [Candidatus Micrarchaeota archaeon]
MDNIKPKNAWMMGQASLEQVILSAVLLGVIAAVFVLSANYSESATETMQAQDAVDQLTAAADFVYTLGPNSREYVTVHLPNDLAGWNITGKAIIITIQTDAGYTDVSSYSKADLIGSLPAFSGTQKILVEHLPSGLVRIGTASLYCAPPVISRGLHAGNSSSDTITISNVANHNITGIGSFISGGGSMISVGDVSPHDLAPGENATMTINYDIPGSAQGGIFGAVITSESPEGDSCFSQITLTVNSESNCNEQCDFMGYHNGTCRASASQCILNNEDYHPEKDYLCGGTPSYPDCCCSPSDDTLGPIANITEYGNTNSSVWMKGMCDDSEKGNSYIGNAQIQLDFGRWSQAYPLNGTLFNSASWIYVFGNLPNLRLLGGMHVIGLRCIDSGGNEGVDYVNISIDYTNSTNNTYVNNTCNIDTLPLPIVLSIWQAPAPAYKLQPLIIYATVNDTGNRNIRNCIIDADNANNWQSMAPVDGNYNQPNETVMYNYSSGFNVGPHIVRVRCTNTDGITGPIAYYYFSVTEPDTLGPIVISMNHTDYPTTLSQITVGGTATDFYTGGSNVSGCNIKLDSGNWEAASPLNGTWNTSATMDFYYNLGSIPVGFHRVYYQCTDSMGNVGGIYNDSFGVVDVDLMLVLDRSGSMDYNVTNVTSGSIVSASSTGWSWAKNLTVAQKNGNTANLSVEIRASASGCTASYEARIGSTVIASGNRTSTSYGTTTTSVNIANQSTPYTISLWLKRDASGCTAYAQDMSLQQSPTKMSAAKTSSKIFLDISGSSTYAGLVSFSTSSTLDKQIAVMSPTNLQALKNSVDAITPSGSTCLECGLERAADELTSARGRPSANKIIILLTDGVGNVGDSIAGAVYCRDRNVTVYTIGFGNDVDEVELTNIALLTYGDYYFAPNAETLTEIFRNIGK